VPTVAVVHDLANLHVPGKYDALRMAYLRWVMLGALRSADVIVAVSGATRADLVHALGPRHDVRVVGNGVDTRRFVPRPPGDPEVAAARARAGLPGPYLLYPSRLEHPGKNHLRLLRAFAASGLARTHVLALSGADWGAGPAIQAERARLGLGDAVRLLGWISDRDMPALVAAAAAVIMAGLHEGFGLPALEALAAGRRVAVSSTGALPEVVGELGVLFDPLDEGSIARALGRAVEPSPEIATAGPRWAAARSWERTAAGLLDACREAIRRRSAAPRGRRPSRR
jgi:glycosyltransferase involved in cell wall biosynthesis